MNMDDVRSNARPVTQAVDLVKRAWAIIDTRLTQSDTVLQIQGLLGTAVTILSNIDARSGVNEQVMPGDTPDARTASNLIVAYREAAMTDVERVAVAVGKARVALSYRPMGVAQTHAALEGLLAVVQQVVFTPMQHNIALMNAVIGAQTVLTGNRTPTEGELGGALHALVDAAKPFVV